MKRDVFDQKGKLIRTEEAIPECGKDFCDRCGDCLHCFPGECVYEDGKELREHWWVVEAEDNG